MELKKNKRIYAMKVVKKELVNDDEVGIFACVCNFVVFVNDLTVLLALKIK